VLKSDPTCCSQLSPVAVPQAAAAEALLRAAFQAAPLLQALLAGGSPAALAAEGRGALQQQLAAVAASSGAVEGEAVELLQVSRSQLLGRLQVGVTGGALGMGLRVEWQGLGWGSFAFAGAVAASANT
jgi:hypothetical protein